MLTALLLSISEAALRAQIGLATLEGSVKDASGAAVPGASVSIKNLGTSLTRSVTTGASGDYVIPDLEPAVYSVTASYTGFRTYTISKLTLHTAEKATVDLVLEVGPTRQEVTVSDVAPLLSTASSEVGQVVNPTTVERVPLNGRKFWQLTQLTPGVSYIPGGQTERTGGSSIRARAVNVTVNGTSAIWTGWSLDGSNITEFELGGTLLQPNVDALQEFKVESADMAAEYGHTPTMVSATLKSGTNQLHGDVFEFLRNDHLDARNFFSLTKDPLKRNQFGGTAGGPIVRNRVFFFGDYQGTRLRQGIVFNNVVPSLAERRGDFSELLSGSKPFKIINPSTRQPFSNNQISTPVSPQAQFLLAFMPPPNFVQGSTSRAIFLNSLAEDQNEGDVKVEADLTPHDRLMNRYSIADNSERDPNPFPALKFFNLNSRVQNETLRWSHIFTPSWINTAQFGYYRSIFLFGGTLQGENIDEEAGIRGFSNPVVVPTPSFPQIDLSPFAAFLGSPSDQRPKSNRIRTWQYADTVSYARARHDLKFGAEWYHQTHGFFNGSRSVGAFSFRGTYTGNSFADFFLGLPDNVQRDAFKTLNGNWDDFKSWFVQDNYRARPDLVVNVGLRLEVNPFFHGIRGQVSGINLTAGKIIVPSIVQTDRFAQPLEPDLLNFFSDRIQLTDSLGLPESIRRSDFDWGPRIGLAWRPLGKGRTVIRLAYGIFYSFPDTNLLDNTVATIPFVAQQTTFNDRPPAAPTRTLADYFQGAPLAAPNPSPGKTCGFGFVALSCDTPDVTAAPLEPRQTSIQEWSFAIQREITGRTSLDLAYLGNRTSRLQQFTQRNDPLPGSGNIQSRRPLPQYGAIRLTDFGGKANYNALQMKFESRDWHHLSLLASYTYAKCLDDGTDESGVTTALIPFNYGPCDFDLTHNAVFSYEYPLPFGRSRRFLGGLSGWADRIAEGWQISGVTTLQSGLPFTPTITGDRANTGVGGQRPDRIAGPALPHSVSCWFFTSANSACATLLPNATDTFVLPPAATRYGTSGRNILRAGRLTQFDFALLKDFKITEGTRIQFRSEFFNIFNHAAFRTPSTAINSSSGGQVGSTLNAARVLQFALKFLF